MIRIRPRHLPCLCLLPLIAACQQPPGDTAEDSAPAPSATAGATPEPDETQKSIIRPEVEPAPVVAPAIEPVRLTIPFPEKGAMPDAAGLALIDELLARPVLHTRGPITLWGHSDSGGSDAINLAASRRRAESVRDYLIEKGVAADRITVIPLGEGRPIAPNRKLDGSVDEAGRAKNRRVELLADLPPAQPAGDADSAASPAATDGPGDGE